ncbi:SRPBCC family protein [Rugamonas sp. CCM 8940]|uniref:SRPBCC family protein n=1 Tax=Rugamonas sp. CCM 8940 TaxID=2765359 RepID=UPI001F160DD0|nr:SRPBCC family protein [Rugamonas sp. CCM 8940]
MRITANMQTMTMTMTAAALLLPAALARAAPPAPPDLGPLAANKVALLDVSKSGVPGKTFAAGTVIAAPLATLCAAIQDFADYPNFMPNVDKVKVGAGAGDSSLLDLTLKLPMGKVKKYRLKMEPKVGAQSCQLAWKMVPSEGLKPDETIADTSGYWQLTPLAADRGKTEVRYLVYTDPGPVPMGFGWIVDSMSKDSIPKMLEALRARVAAH